MKPYILIDMYGKYQVVESNFPYPGSICEAPMGATNMDGDLIDIDENGVPSINQERKAAKEALRAQVAIDRKWLNMRNQRSSILDRTDWTLQTGSPLSAAKKALWKDYRQELRDLPENVSDINNVQWPVKPE